MNTYPSCGNCKFFSPEVHYSGGEQGWCIFNPYRIDAMLKMFDDPACECFNLKKPVQEKESE